jgi:hypothetical protein
MSSLKEQRLILAHAFRGFSPWSVGYLTGVSGAAVKQSVMAEGQRKAVHLMVARKQRDRERQEGAEDRCILLENFSS